MNSSENKVASSPLSVTAGFGSYVCDRWGGEDSPACNEDGSPAIVEGNEVIVRDYWEDERGPHFSTDRHPVDGERFYWSAPNIRDEPRAKRVGSGDLLGRVLVACEYSGAVRDAFAARGWEAWSCDLLPSETPGHHYQGDVRDMLGEGWDILIAHPPCTHLAVSGARWFPAKRASGEQQAALDFVRLLLAAPVPHIALENPVSIISSKIRKPDQVIQPWQFGHGEVKATCLWLKNLPKLTPTRIVEGREARVHKMPPGPDRWKERSRTLPGIAQAFADQWTRATRPNAADERRAPKTQP